MCAIVKQGVSLGLLRRFEASPTIELMPENAHEEAIVIFSINEIALTGNAFFYEATFLIRGICPSVITLRI